MHHDVLAPHGRFRAMADESSVMMWVTDADGIVQFINRACCEFFGIERDQLREPHAWHALVHPDDLPQCAAEFAACLRSGLPFHAEVRVRRRDHEWRHVASYAAPHFSPDGRVIGFVGCSPDVTEPRHAADRQRQRSALTEEFVTTVAHELRQPIHAAVAALRLLGSEDSAAQERARAVLDRQIGQMARLVDDLLEVSRLARGPLALHRRVLDLRQVVRHAIDTMAPAILERQHRIEVVVPDTPVMVNGDAARLEQVLVNVLSNAAKYTPPCGRMQVNVEATPRLVTIRVKDNGIGIPHESLTRIFEAFTRVDATADGGLGIGLAVARKLLEQHGGTIEARSSGAGCGSEFVIRLAAAAAAPPAASP